MKYVLSSFGLHNPYIVAPLPDHAVYPVGLEGDDFIDLDYSLLLVGTGFLLDKWTLEYLRGQSDRLRFLAPMLSSISRLESEGLLETFDGRRIVSENLSELQGKTEWLCNDVQGWLEAVRSQWNVLRDDREFFLARFGTAERRAINEHHFAVANAVLRIDGKMNTRLLKELTDLICSRRKVFSQSESDRVKEVLRPLVCHTVTQDLVRFKTSGSVLDWDDSQPYYQRLYAARWDQDDSKLLAHHARSLFSLSLPELRPRSVDDVVRFIRDNRNVSELREDITRLLSKGEKFDEALGRRIVSEVLRAELSVKKKMKRIRWLGAVLSVLVPGGSLVTEAAVEGITMLGEDVVEDTLARSHRWLYALQQG